MCRHKNKNSPKTELLFLHTPIQNINEDAIGVEAYVNMLNRSIDSGAQMIAVTSPFGSGKTSIVELLRNRRCKKRFQCKISVLERVLNWIMQLKHRESIVKVSMWSQFSEKEGALSTTNLHRTLLYHIVSAIDKKRGTYINRRLSSNYGFLKIHANRKGYTIVLFLFLFLFSAIWFKRSFPAEFSKLLPFFQDEKSSVWLSISTIIMVILSVVLLLKADIIFSSSKSEREREIEADEIIDLYRSEVLEYGYLQKHYIVVLEDLDRSDDGEGIINFLKELRKYYVPDISEYSKPYRNKVTFIVNIMPESMLSGANVHEPETENQLNNLFAKLFDFTISLPKVNIDNYDAILEGILFQNKKQIEELGLVSSGKLSDIPGMQWILREPQLGIREIKKRLNIAFSLYSSLKTKFPFAAIVFEKCAVVAYVTTAFEREFFGTDDRAFQNLVEGYIGKIDTDGVLPQLPSDNTEYVKTIETLVQARLIDSNYRTYFYNYPKGSFLYSIDESNISNAILYNHGEEHDELINQSLKNISLTGSTVVRDSYIRIEKLNILLPDIVFRIGALYSEALISSFPSVLRYFESRDYSPNALGKIMTRFLNLSKDEKVSQYYSKEHAEAFCRLWIKKLDTDSILMFRKRLCVEQSKQISWYSLFFSVDYPFISKEELDSISITDAISVINPSHEEFSLEVVQYIFDRYHTERPIDSESQRKVKTFLLSVAMYNPPVEFIRIVLEFMMQDDTIDPQLEAIVIKYLSSEDDGKDENDLSVTNQSRGEYIKLINSHASMGLSENTTNYILATDRYSGYSEIVANAMRAKGEALAYLQILLINNLTIDFNETYIQETIRNNIAYFLDKLDIFNQLRLLVCENATNLSSYDFLFDVDYPLMTIPELEILAQRKDFHDQDIIKRISPDYIDIDTALKAISIFCRKSQTNNNSFMILQYIMKFPDEILSSCFLDIDFSKIKYRSLAAARKDKIKKRLETVMQLDTDEGKLSFMELTNHLDPNWENEIVDSLKADEGLMRRYAALVNKQNKISATTHKTLISLPKYFPMSETVNKELRKRKSYTYYVVSQILGKESFEMAPLEQREELWKTYMRIFKSSGLDRTRKYMTENQEFLDEIITRREYVGMSEEQRIQLSTTIQNADSLNDLERFSSKFVLEYCLNIKGFSDKNAAESFLKLLDVFPDLLASNELYYHIHPKLVDPSLKAKYTIARKKAGYMDENHL